MGSKKNGEDNPHWKGGTRNWWAKHLKQTIGKCEKCESIKLLEIHHKDHDDTNNKRENIILLCRYCHRSIEHLGKKGVTKGMKFSGMVCKNGKLFGQNNSYKKEEFRKKLSYKKKEYYRKLKELEGVNKNE